MIVGITSWIVAHAALSARYIRGCAGRQLRGVPGLRERRGHVDIGAITKNDRGVTEERGNGQDGIDDSIQQAPSVVCRPHNRCPRRGAH